jgi:hypothetical protein
LEQQQQPKPSTPRYCDVCARVDDMFFNKF